MKKYSIIILAIFFSLRSFPQSIQAPGLDTIGPKASGHQYTLKRIYLQPPLYNPNDSSAAVDLSGYYSRIQVDSLQLLKLSGIGTNKSLAKFTSAGTITNSFGAEDSLVNAFQNSLYVGTQLNIINNSKFSSDNDWIKSKGWTISGGSANANSADPYYSIYQYFGKDSGSIYVVEYDISAYSAGSLRAIILGGVGKLHSGIGHFVDIITTSADPNIAIRPDANGFSGSITNFTASKISGGNLIVSGNSFFRNKSYYTNHPSYAVGDSFAVPDIKYITDSVASAGVYLPIITNKINVSFCSADTATYSKSENIVTVGIDINWKPAVANSPTTITFTIPIAVARFPFTYWANGIVSCQKGSLNYSGVISAVLSGTKVTLTAYPTDITPVNMIGTFQYRIR